MVTKFFKLQLKYPIKGDWVSMCRKDLKEMKIELTLNEIRTMPKESFIKQIKSKISEISLKYLLKKEVQKTHGNAKGVVLFVKNEDAR